jgi:hypothetical protein
MDGYRTMTENAGSKISCHYTPNPINYDLRDKSVPELVPFITI